MDEMAEQSSCQIPCGEIKEMRGALAKLINTVAVSTATTDLRVKRVEDGVSNYVKFMTEARTFFADGRAAKDAEQKFRDIRDEENKASALAAANHIKELLDERHEKADKRDRVFKCWMSIATLIIAVFMAWIAYREYERKVVDVAVPAPIVNSAPLPQNTSNQPNY
jgi:hypothetical protein